MPDYTRPVCRGSLALGTSCGLCERCADEKAKLAKLANVTRIRHELTVSNELARQVAAMDNAIAKAIDAAKAAGIPQGLVVGILHGHAHAETHKMVVK